MAAFDSWEKLPHAPGTWQGPPVSMLTGEAADNYSSKSQADIRIHVPTQLSATIKTAPVAAVLEDMVGPIPELVPADKLLPVPPELDTPCPEANGSADEGSNDGEGGCAGFVCDCTTAVNDEQFCCKNKPQPT